MKTDIGSAGFSEKHSMLSRVSDFLNSEGKDWKVLRHGIWRKNLTCYLGRQCWEWREGTEMWVPPNPAP